MRYDAVNTLVFWFFAKKKILHIPLTRISQKLFSHFYYKFYFPGTESQQNE